MDFFLDLHDMEVLIEPSGVSVTLLGLEEDTPEIRLTWKTPSLISCFALMAIQDARTGTRVETCPTCHQVFSTDARQTIYCSDACAWRDRKRKARAAAKEKAKSNGKKTRE
jgi:hypothetical protein